MSWRALAPYGALVAIAVAATWPVLVAPGMPYNVDISGFFPLTTEAYEARFWPLWNEHGGMSTLQFLPALLFELPLLLVGRFFGWDIPIHIKVRLVLGFALAGVTMFALARHYVLRRRPDAAPLVAIGAPMAAALLYMLNPWSVHRAFQYFLWLGYALAPLVLLAMERLAEAPGWRRALALGAVLAFATTDPHNPAHFALLLAPLALLRLAPLLRRARWPDAKRLVTTLALAGGLYAALSAFWILPYAYNAVHDPGFGPSYVMSEEMLDTLSRHGSFLDAVRLLHNYLPRADLAPVGGWILPWWTTASYLVPILALAALVLDRSRVALAYGALAAATIFLGMGTHGPAPGAYRWLLFAAPWGEGLSWLFRDPYRWGGMQALAYGVLLALALAAIASWRPDVRLVRFAAPAAGITAVLLFAAPAVANYVQGPYSPLVVPDEYAEANALLAGSPADASVVWMPRMLGDTTWSGDKTLEYFDATSSARPALGPFRPHTSVYFDFLKDAAKDGADVSPLLARVGADRILYHNDVDTVTGARAIADLERQGLVQAARVGSSPTLVVDVSTIAPAYTPAARHALQGDDVLVQEFTPTRAHPSLLALRATAKGSPGALHVEVKDASGAVVAARVAPQRGPDIAIPLDGVLFHPGETYTLTLRAPAASGPDDRYDVSYYTGSGDLSFDILAEERGFAVELVSPDPAPRVRAAPGPVASPSGLQLLRALSALPQDAQLRDAPVLFVQQDASAASAFATTPGAWTWVSTLDGSPLDGVVPFLPLDTFVSPFKATANADAKQGWARGTQDFVYYQWGWSTSVASIKQESWDFDGGDGLVYSSPQTPASLPLAIPSSSEPIRVLARVFESPKGGALAFHAGDRTLATLSTRSNVTGFRWVDLGEGPAGATSIRMESIDGYQGVDALAVVPRSAFDAAVAASVARFEETSVALVQQAETVPGLDVSTVAIPDVGRVSKVAREANVTFSLPAAGAPDVWLRVPADGALPTLAVDGAAVPALACRAACGGPARWVATPLGPLAAGAHTLRIEASEAPALVDAIAISTDASLFTSPSAPVAWTRVSATEYRAHLGAHAPTLLALAVPYDAGWVARLADGTSVRSVPVDGVANGFALPADARDVTLVYEPQTWARTGAVLAGATALTSLTFLGGATLLRRRSSSPQETLR